MKNLFSTGASRPTIGFLTTNIGKDQASINTWLGIIDAAQKYDVDLVCFIGDELQSHKGFQDQGNLIYDLVGAANVDGLIIWNSALSNFIGKEAFSIFCERFQPLPMVDLVDLNEPATESFEYRGMRVMLHHLLHEHGYRRIAFIRGPDGNATAEKRYAAYPDALIAHGIPFDPDLVVMPGYWSEASGQEAIRILLDERHAQFEAVLTASDGLAIGAMTALQTRGLRIPQDVAVASFDNIPDACVVTPPLTTIPFPLRIRGERAITALLAKIRPHNLLPQVILPTDIVIRRSCGCFALPMTQIAVELSRLPAKTLSAFTATSRESLLSELARFVSQPVVAAPWLEQLVDALYCDLTESDRKNFLTTVDLILNAVMRAEQDVAEWHAVLSELRRQMLPYLDDSIARLKAEDLWQQARFLISETMQRAQAYHILQAERRAQVVRDIGATLITTFDIAQLLDILADGLPRLGIPGCYLALYAHLDRPTESARLIFAYNHHGRVSLEPGGREFPTRELVPADILPADHRTTLIIEPLYFRMNQLGLIVFEVGPRDAPIYDILRDQISSALEGALLVEREHAQAVEIARQKYVLDTFMANVPDSIYFKDRDSRVTLANSSLSRLLGYPTPAAIIGKSDFDFFPEEQARPKYDQEQEIISTGEPLLALEEPDAAGRWALTTKMPLRDEYGEIIGTFGISRDITPLKNAQKQVEDAYAEIQKLNEQLKRENLRMGAELEVARRLQQMVLPMPEELTRIPGLEIVGYMQPAEEVGGDYYDVLHCQQGRVCIGIGDVTGHGLESGVLMLMTQTAIRTLVDRGETDPVIFLNTINRVLYQNIQRMGVDRSLTLAMVNYQNGQLRIIGQHEEALVVRRDGRIERMDTMELGFPLGMVDDIRQWVAEATMTLAPGDGVVLYTDGITEAQNATNHFYGLERLCAVISANWRDASAEAVKEAIVADVRAFVGDAQVYDDVTLVVLKQQ